MGVCSNKIFQPVPLPLLAAPSKWAKVTETLQALNQWEMHVRQLISLSVSLFQEMSRAFVTRTSDQCGNLNAAQELRDQVT